MCISVHFGALPFLEVHYCPSLCIPFLEVLVCPSWCIPVLDVHLYLSRYVTFRGTNICQVLLRDA